MGTDAEFRDRLHDVLHEKAVQQDMEPGLVLTGWVVVAAAKGFDDEGEAVTQVLVMPSQLAEFEVLGLLRHAVIRTEADIVESYRGEA